MRTYPPIVDRQQGADRLVFNENDLRTVLGQALVDGSVSTIRLGADIIASTSFVLAGTYDVVIDGGQRYGFLASTATTLTEFFTVAASTTVEGLAFRGVSFIEGPDLVIRCADATSTLRRVDFHDCYLDFVHDVVLGDGGAPTWADSVVEGCTFLLERDGLFISPGFGQAVLSRCHLSRSTGVDLSGGVYVVHVDNAAGSDGNTYLGVAAMAALGPNDVYLATTAAEETVLARPVVIGTRPSPSLDTIDFTQALAYRGAVRWLLQGAATTVGATGGVTIVSFSPQPSRTYLIDARFVARRTNGTDEGAAWQIVQRFQVGSTGSVTVAPTLSSTTNADTGATYAAAIDTDSLHQTIRFRCDGTAGHNVSWTVSAVVDEV